MYLICYVYCDLSKDLKEHPTLDVKVDLIVVVACPKCGADVNEDDRFCGRCGSFLSLEAGKVPVQKKRYTRERDACFGEGERERDQLGLVSFGIFLLIVGYIFITNPSIFSDFRLWIEQVTSEKVLTRPSGRLITSAVYFFVLIGLSSFFQAGIRLIIDKVRRRALSRD